MKLLFKQRMFSWFDSYDIYDEAGAVVFTVKGQLAWGHCFKIYNSQGYCLGTVREKIWSFLPKFEIYSGDEQNYIGCISKEFTFFKPKYNIDFNGWHVEGSFMEWDYDVLDQQGRKIATVSKELFHWTDTYIINIFNPGHALEALMFVLAIDAEKCSRNG